jgi:aspartate aminotransferase
MFDSLAVLPPDSILGLAAACRADSNPDKVDLTLGVYMDETGLMPCVRGSAAGTARPRTGRDDQGLYVASG